ncbi:MAG TPA: O-methyltransferase [Bacteroidetes bacterium]|nr:O-methyltransferase [Bacteroidota bacterium]
MRSTIRLVEYCEQISTPPRKLLMELERETNLKTLAPQMITGFLQGQFLSMISRWKNPRTILEIGTFTGYGTLCLVEGLQENGILHTIEVNPELSHISQKYFDRSKYPQQIVQHIGDAKELIPDIGGPIDLVYMDAGKNDYALHFDLVFEKLGPGGTVLVDNVLWSGKVGQGLKDKDTMALEAFNEKIKKDKRVTNLLLPLRDGLMIIEKK